jgi:hypothetical protein
VLARSAAYALGEALDWRVGLAQRPGRARAFYGTIAVATCVGAVLNFTLSTFIDVEVGTSSRRQQAIIARDISSPCCATRPRLHPVPRATPASRADRAEPGPCAGVRGQADPCRAVLLFRPELPAAHVYPWQ